MKYSDMQQTCLGDDVKSMCSDMPEDFYLDKLYAQEDPDHYYTIFKCEFRSEVGRRGVYTVTVTAFDGNGPDQPLTDIDLYTGSEYVCSSSLIGYDSENGWVVVE